MTAWMLGLCLAATASQPLAIPADAESVPELPPADPPKKVKWFPLVLPLAAANTTDGLGVGLGGELYTRPIEMESGYRFKITATLWVTTSLQYTSDWVRVEWRNKRHWLGLVGYRLWTNNLYAGAGGADVLVDWGEEERGNFIAGPFAFFGVAQDIAPNGMEGFVQSSFRHVVVEPGPDSLLAQRNPFGGHGGTYADLNVGMQHYRTDTFPMPNRGFRAEVATRVGLTITPDEAQPLLGVHAELIRWFPLLNDWVVIGGRIVGEKTVGQRPFFEQGNLGGRWRDELGLDQALPGYGRSRSRGDGIVAAMVEVRPRLFHIQAGWFDLMGTLSLFAEQAWLFDQWDPGPPLPSVGVGANALWQGAIQVRPYVAWGWRADEPGGERFPVMQYGFSFMDPL